MAFSVQVREKGREGGTSPVEHTSISLTHIHIDIKVVCNLFTKGDGGSSATCRYR